MVVVDTSIVVDHLRQTSNTNTLLQSLDIEHKQLAVSVTTVQELFTGQSSAIRQGEQSLITTLSTFGLLPITYSISELAGRISRDYPRRISFADATIAATAILYEAKLATLNVKDFKDIPNLELVELNQP